MKSNKYSAPLPAVKWKYELRGWEDFRVDATKVIKLNPASYEVEFPPCGHWEKTYAKFRIMEAPDSIVDSMEKLFDKELQKHRYAVSERILQLEKAQKRLAALEAFIASNPPDPATEVTP